MPKKKDSVRIYRIVKKISEINELIGNKGLEKILEDTETMKLIELSLVNFSGYIGMLSSHLKEEYPSDDIW